MRVRLGLVAAPAILILHVHTLSSSLPLSMVTEGSLDELAPSKRKNGEQLVWWLAAAATVNSVNYAPLGSVRQLSV